MDRRRIIVRILVTLLAALPATPNARAEPVPDSTYGRLAVRADPPTAEVYINGGRQLRDHDGVVRVAVAEGPVTVEVRQVDFATQRDTVSVARGELVELDIRLVPAGGAVERAVFAAVLIVVALGLVAAIVVSFGHMGPMDINLNISTRDGDGSRQAWLFCAARCGDDASGESGEAI